MRLSELEIDAIKAAINKYFEQEARVYLFGSRVDEDKSGGDIDLYVETELTGQELIKAKLQAMSEIQLRIGDRKIDIVTASSQQSTHVPLVIQEARKFGIAL